MFDPEMPMFDPEMPMFDPETPMFDPEMPMFDPEMPMFDPETPMFDRQTLSVNREIPVDTGENRNIASISYGRRSGTGPGSPSQPTMRAGKARTRP
jgi:DNA-directed RNA polymerase II subunit RPB1